MPEVSVQKLVREVLVEQRPRAIQRIAVLPVLPELTAEIVREKEDEDIDRDQRDVGDRHTPVAHVSPDWNQRHAATPSGSIWRFQRNCDNPASLLLCRARHASMPAAGVQQSSTD